MKNPIRLLTCSLALMIGTNAGAQTSESAESFPSKPMRARGRWDRTMLYSWMHHRPGSSK